MSYWILQWNPNNYKLDGGNPYRVGEEDWWGISFCLDEVKPGDTAFIWQSIDYQHPTGPRPRGIYAKATIVSVPPHKPEVQARIDEMKKADTQTPAKQKQKPSLLIKYIASYYANPLTDTELKIAGLEKIHILQCPRPEISKLSDSGATSIKALLHAKGYK